MNDPFVGDMAQALAARVANEATSSEEARIQRLYAIALGRPPTRGEIDVGLRLVTRDGEVNVWERYCQIVLCSNEFIYLTNSIFNHGKHGRHGKIQRQESFKSNN